jgi:hypothetical protein
MLRARDSNGHWLLCRCLRGGAVVSSVGGARGQRGGAFSSLSLLLQCMWRCAAPPGLGQGYNDITKWRWCWAGSAYNQVALVLGRRFLESQFLRAPWHVAYRGVFVFFFGECFFFFFSFGEKIADNGAQELKRRHPKKNRSSELLRKSTSILPLGVECHRSRPLTQAVTSLALFRWSRTLPRMISSYSLGARAGLLRTGGRGQRSCCLG